MIRKYFKKIFEYGIDIISMVMMWVAMKPSIEMSALMLVYSILRIFFVRHIFVIVLVNTTILYTIVSNSMNHRIRTEGEIVMHSSITVLLLILAAVQVFVILFRVFSIQDKNYITAQEENPSFIKRLYIAVHNLHHTVTIILATIYPIILTVVIIITFAGIYNSANGFYSSIGAESGLIYSATGDMLDTIDINRHLTTYTELENLMDKDYIYFSTVTYFTIGYGDIVPKGLNMKTIIMLEMLMAHILNISIFALFGTLFYEFIKHRNIKNIFQ